MHSGHHFSGPSLLIPKLGKVQSLKAQPQPPFASQAASQTACHSQKVGGMAAMCACVSAPRPEGAEGGEGGGAWLPEGGASDAWDLTSFPNQVSAFLSDELLKYHRGRISICDTNWLTWNS